MKKEKKGSKRIRSNGSNICIIASLRRYSNTLYLRQDCQRKIMKIQVGDIVKVLGEKFLHLVLDLHECEPDEFNQALVQRLGDAKDRWVNAQRCEIVENN